MPANETEVDMADLCLFICAAKFTHAEMTDALKNPGKWWAEAAAYRLLVDAGYKNDRIEAAFEALCGVSP